MQGAAKEAHPGEVVGGRFRVEAQLGEGGMAQVFSVVDVASGKPYALKLIKQEVAADAQAVARVRREGEVLTSLDNPAVVAIETFGKLDDGRLFIAMELLEGETLGDRMRREKRLSLEDLIPIVTGAAAGLTAAHQAGVIHRDLKPDNIFLQQLEGGRIQVKLLDFGISKVYGVEERLTRTGQILGTPRYMAPEQLAADHDLDGRVDTYALGVILYEALAGSPPFIATSPSDLIVAILHGKVTPLSTLRADLSEDVLAVIMRAMARAREARYASPRELAEAFLEAVGGARTSSPGPRHGVGTAVLGGGGAPLVDAPAREEGLRVGTFSALQQISPPSASSSVSKTVAGKKKPTPTPSVSEPEPEPRASDSYPIGTASDSFPLGDVSGDFSASTALPTNSRRWIWIAAALIAGGLSAALALILLESNADAEPAIEAPPQSAVEPLVGVPASNVEQSLTNDDVDPNIDADADMDGVDMEALPTGAIAPDEPIVDGEPEHRTMMRARMSTMMDAEGDVPDPFVSDVTSMDTSMDPYTRARAELQSGDAEGCLSILRDARLRGPRPLRLEGDCFLRAGHRDDAVKAYEEFCRRYPDNSSTAAIRGLVESLGGSCP